MSSTLKTERISKNILRPTFNERLKIKNCIPILQRIFGYLLPELIPGQTTCINISEICGSHLRNEFLKLGIFVMNTIIGLQDSEWPFDHQSSGIESMLPQNPKAFLCEGLEFVPLELSSASHIRLSDCRRAMGAMRKSKSPSTKLNTDHELNYDIRSWGARCEPNSSTKRVSTTYGDGDMLVYLEYTRRESRPLEERALRSENTVLLRCIPPGYKGNDTSPGFQILFHQKIWDHMRLNICPILSFHCINIRPMTHRFHDGEPAEFWPPCQVMKKRRGWGEIYDLVGHEDIDRLRNNTSMEKPSTTVTSVRLDSPRGLLLE